MNIRNVIVFIMFAGTFTVEVNFTAFNLQQPHRQQKFINIIGELNEKLRIEWNAIFVCDLGQELEDVIKSSKVPALIMTNDMGTRLKTSHSRQVMTIILAESSTLNQTFETIQHTIKPLQPEQILWVIPNARDIDLWRLANRSWRFGHSNVLFYTYGELFTYHPVPSITIRRILQIDDYVKEREVVDFQKYPLKIGLKRFYPYYYDYLNRFGKTIRTGIFYDIIKIFARHYNFKLKHYEVDYSVWDEIQHKKKSHKKGIDILSVIMINKNGSFSIPSDVLWNTRITILVPHPTPVSKAKYVLYPFSGPISIFTLAVFFLCTFAVALIYYKQDDTDGIAFGRSALYVFALFIYQYQVNLQPKTASQKLVFLSLVIIGFVTSNLYWAKLSSLLVRSIYERKIEKLDELNDTPLQILMNEFFYYTLQNKFHVSDTLLTKAKIVDFNTLYSAQSDLNNTNCILVEEPRVTALLSQQRYMKKPRMYMLKDALGEEPLSIHLKNDSPFLWKFNLYLKYLMDSGILSKILGDMNAGGISSGELRYFIDEESSDELHLDSFFYFTLVAYLMFGLILAFIIFALECVYFRYKDTTVKFKK